MVMYRIVVAVPTKYMLAFSPPASLGCTEEDLGAGRLSALGWAGGRSRVGSTAAVGSIVMYFGFAIIVV